MSYKLRWRGIIRLFPLGPAYVRVCGKLGDHASVTREVVEFCLARRAKGLP